MCSRSKKYCWKLDYQIFFSFRKYDWIEYEDGTVLGRKGQCEGKHFQKETLSTQLYGSNLRTLTLFLGSVVSQSFWCCHKLVLPSIYPICLSVCLSICIHLSVRQSYLPNIQSSWLPAYFHACLPTSLSVVASICPVLLPIFLSVSLSFHQPNLLAFLSFCVSTSLSLCMPVCLPSIPLLCTCLSVC